MSGSKNNQSISKFADQLIRYYRIPVRSSKEDALNSILEKIDQKEKSLSKKTRKLSPVFLVGISAAATVAIIVTFWFFTASITISAGEGSVLTYRLPDSSRVVLQENSEIKYRKYNWKRNVNLIGEAYFEVEKGPGFRVKTKLGSVEVLGTRFLVSELGEQLKVQCFEGHVKTSYNDKSWLLEPGTQFTGKKEVTEKKELETKTDFPGFARFQQSFSNAGLTEVVNEIESFFNVDIEIQNGINKNFSGSIQTGNLESTLQIVCQSLHLNYRFEGSNKIIIFK